MAPRVTWPTALAWRLSRQLLDPVGDLETADVVRRLCGVQAQVPSAAELAIRLRQGSSEGGDVAAALGDGRLVRTWAMRGTLHLLTPEDGGHFLSLLAAGRTWERPSWIRYFKVRPEDWPELRAVVRDSLAGRVRTRQELAAAIAGRPRFAHLEAELGSSWGTLFKPLAWMGELCLGPSLGNRVTFTSPSAASPRWAGVPPAETAAPAAIAAYLRAYGPATVDHFAAWLSRGWSPKRQLAAWFRGLGDRVAEVDLEGQRAYVLAEDLDSLVAARPSDAVRLLGGFDQWVLGPGTDESHVVPAARRGDVSRAAGWIAPVVIAGGVVTGTWEMDANALTVAWFPEAGRVPKRRVRAEVERLRPILGGDRRLVITEARPPRVTEPPARSGPAPTTRDAGRART
jgi:hypothetical protein